MPYMICALEDLDEIENIVPVEIVILLQLAVLNGKIEYMYLQRRFVFMLPYCTHVQWMTYCEGAILSLTRSLRTS